MKKSIIISLLSAAFIFLCQTMSAIPAKPGKIVLTQPDGTSITVIVHGDEWFHYTTDEFGRLLEEDSNGFMVRSNKTFDQIQAKMSLAQNARTHALELSKEAVLKAKATGSPKIPVVLVQFSDKSFTISNPKQAFTNLLTQTGYSANGGTGCVLDYYKDQSRGAYTPQFVVMDVVTLSGKMSTYGSTDEYAAKALYEACQKLDATVDFSQFDNDKDGKIDMALLYYAGYNEAEGASSSTIWPHQYYVPYVVTNAQAFDGVTLNRYFCTSELKGYSGSNMCGIGTTCHEFAHSIGLPDFYDTNYNEYGDGEAGATYEYDVMCSGPYNNNGCTPPWMNAEELVMLGWMDSITELTSTGTVTIPSIAASTPVAYKTSTSASGEYFLYECRPGTVWDAPLTPGLLVYHVDKSPSHTITFKRSSSASTSQTAYNLWANWETYNAINCNGSHPCFYIVPSGNQTSLNYTGSSFTFPGRSNITTYTPVDWAGKETGISASNITFDSSSQTVTFKLANTNAAGISGVVMDSEGNPLSGVTVTLRAEASAASSATGAMKAPLVIKAEGAVLASVTTNATGSYSFDIDEYGTYNVSAAKSGYVSKSANVEVSRMVTQNFYLLREGETVASELFTYPTSGVEWGDYGSSSYSSWDLMCANYYPTSMLGAYAGKQIKSISFSIAGTSTTTGTVHALVDFGNQRVACVEVKNPVVNDWTTVDLTGEELIIPEGKDIFAGYAIKSWTYGYPFTATDPASSELVGYMADYGLTSTAWEAWSYVFRIKLTVGDYTAPDTGYCFIDNPGDGIYHVGDSLPLSLKETELDRKPSAEGVRWFFDDEPVSGEVIFKTPGLHTLKAKFKTSVDTEKTIFLDVEVQ